MKFTDLQNVAVEPQAGSTIKITAEVPFSELTAVKAAALEKLGQNVAIDGFRKGHIPENVLVDRIGEMALLTEMAERAIRKAYPLIVTEKNLEVIGYPQIAITKIAKDNPLGFTATVAVVPDITLPDYKAIAKEINTERESAEVTEVDVEKQVEDILRQKAAYERLQAKAAASGSPDASEEAVRDKAAKKAEADAKESEQKDLGNVTELPTPDTITKGDEAEETEESEPALPELTDELVKTLGQPGQFESVAHFKGQIREHLAVEKKREVEGKHRAKLTDAIIEKTTLELPEVLVEAELGQMFGQMKDDLARAQLKFEDYLNHIKKTEEDLKTEWRPSAENRAKLQLVLNAIAKEEKIVPDKGAVDHEIDHILEHHKDADRERVRVYVESVISNDMVMKLLEEQK